MGDKHRSNAHDTDAGNAFGPWVDVFPPESPKVIL